MSHSRENVVDGGTCICRHFSASSRLWGGGVGMAKEERLLLACLQGV